MKQLLRESRCVVRLGSEYAVSLSHTSQQQRKFKIAELLNTLSKGVRHILSAGFGKPVVPKLPAVVVE
jgi:hypothetical protein